MIETKSWTETALEGIQNSWRELLGDSSADPLFNSPEWLTTWWRQYGPVIGAELDIRAVLDNGQLIGLALLHVREVQHRFRLAGLRYELLGTAWRTRSVGFSEKTAILFRSGTEEQAAEALIESLSNDSSWGDLIVSLTPRDGLTHQVFQAVARGVGGYLREPDFTEAWEIPLERSFGHFIAGLGSGTRARVMGSRTRLERAGGFRERIFRTEELDEGWEIFSQLHKDRWNRPFSPHWREFYGTIAKTQSKYGVPAISVLEFGGEAVSAMINFRAGLREYSIASAFVPVGVKRVSVGWMHLGLAVERACADGMTHFDLLGGTGKNEQYKAAFGGQRSELVTLQLVRTRNLAAIYRAWDAVQAMRERWQRIRGSI